MVKLTNNDKIKSNYNLVLYGDGSADNMSGECASGFTGYLYSDETLGKSNSDKPSKYIISNIGYLETELLPKYGEYKTVIPDYYIDGSMYNNERGTNNIGELNSFIYPIEYLFKDNVNHYNIKSIYFKSDSSYVLKVLDYIYNYKKEEWESKLNCNKELTDKILDIITILKDNNIKLEWMKVLGHSTSLGNNLADRLAIHSRYNKYSGVSVVEAKKHWGKTLDIHPLLKFRQAFFMTKSSPTAEPMYTIMDYKINEEVGKKTHDALFGITILNKEEPIARDAIDMFSKQYGSLSLLSTLDLKAITSRTCLYYYSIFGNNVFRFQYQNRSLMSMEDMYICRNVYPPGLAIQAYEKMVELYNILNEYRTNKPINNRIFTDITDIFYLSKKNKKICTILNGINKIEFNKELYGQDLKIILVLGTDAPSRTQFKILENIISKVVLSTIKINKMIDYQVIIETTDKDYGIYTNLYSCKIFLK